MNVATLRTGHDKDSPIAQEALSFLLRYKFQEIQIIPSHEGPQSNFLQDKIILLWWHDLKNGKNFRKLLGQIIEGFEKYEKLMKIGKFGKSEK